MSCYRQHSHGVYAIQGLEGLGMDHFDILGPQIGHLGQGLLNGGHQRWAAAFARPKTVLSDHQPLV